MNRLQLVFATAGNYFVLLFTSFDAQALNEKIVTSGALEIDMSSQFDELIKLLFSIIGGILSTIVLNLLKRKFPDFFKLLFSEDTNRSQS